MGSVEKGQGNVGEWQEGLRTVEGYIVLCLRALGPRDTRHSGRKHEEGERGESELRREDSYAPRAEEDTRGIGGDRDLAIPQMLASRKRLFVGPVEDGQERAQIIGTRQAESGGGKTRWASGGGTRRGVGDGGWRKRGRRSTEDACGRGGSREREAPGGLE